MKRFVSALLGLVLLLLFPLAAHCEYNLTPASVSKEMVVQKLMDLEYLAPDLMPKDEKDAIPAALLAFQADQGIVPDVPQAISSVLDTRTLVRLFAQTDDLPSSVWVPVYGGQRYHSREGCSNMSEPEPVSILTAVALGFTPCKRCKP